MFAMFVPTLITEVARAIASAHANASPRPSLTSIASNPLSSAILPSSTNSLGGAAVAVDSTIPSRSVAIPDSSPSAPTPGAGTSTTPAGQQGQLPDGLLDAELGDLVLGVAELGEDGVAVLAVGGGEAPHAPEPVDLEGRRWTDEAVVEGREVVVGEDVLVLREVLQPVDGRDPGTHGPQFPPPVRGRLRA